MIILPKNYKHFFISGWAYRYILRYFKKSEDNVLVDELPEAKGFHGKGGLIKVDSFFSYDPIKDFIMEAYLDLGYTLNVDVNAEEQTGFTFLQGFVDHGKRQSTADTFLAMAVNRTNLHVIKNAHVTKVLIDNAGSAKGVQILINGKSIESVTKKEIILSAGAIGSPQILLNSGVGPKEELEKLDISVKKNLAVGKNLQDHLAVIVPIKMHKSYAQPVPKGDVIDDMYMYLLHKIGSFSHIGIMDLTGFLNTLNKTSEWPDIQLNYLAFRRGEEEKLQTVLEKYGFDEYVQESLKASIEKTELVLVMVVLLNPKSTGSVQLRSKNPMDKPKIFGNYMNVREDVETMIRGVNLVKRFIHTPSAKNHEVEIVRVNIPGCAEIEFDKLGYWECYIRHMSTSVFNPTSSCKMGPDSDPEAVVDARLMVKGIKGLRVIDASIMPNIISGGTNAPTIMIAEKGADLIKDDWKNIKTEL